jgi:exopolysaccharide production protein ExoZ
VRYGGVQALRALAASAVVIGHSATYGLIAAPDAIAVLGYSGVDVFFVISGFIICRVATRANGSAWSFLGKRYWRIFPLYWIVLAFSVAINAAGVSTSPEWMQWRPGLEYVFLLTTENRFVPPAWTLGFELYFYSAVALILLIARNRFYPTLAVWLFVQAGSAALFGQSSGPLSNVLVLEFGFGCLVAWLISQGLAKFAVASFLIGLIPFAVGAIF